MTHRSNLWTVGIVAVLLCFCCSFATGAKYLEVQCQNRIDQGDIFAYLRKFPSSDPASKSVLQHAVSVIGQYPKSFWQNAQITVFGPDVSVVFFAGNRNHEFVISSGVDGKIAIETPEIKIQADKNCGEDSLLDCLESFTTGTFIPKDKQDLFNAAFQRILFYDEEVLKNARLEVKGPGIAISLHSGDARNKFSVQMITGKIQTNAEVSTPVVHVDCGYRIKRTDVQNFVQESSNRFITNADVWTATFELLNLHRDSVWRDAELTVWADGVNVVFSSGEGTNQFQVTCFQGEVIVRNIATSWTVTFSRIFQKLGAYVLENVGRVFDFLRRLAPKLIA